MSINQRQFDQLTEMGISLWQHKAVAFDQNSPDKHVIKQKDDYINIEQDNKSLSHLAKQKIFTDILQCLELSIGEISHKKDHLDLGLFNWYFSSKTNDEISIHCANNNLFSPSITLISQSPALKKQLWKVITQNLL